LPFLLNDLPMADFQAAVAAHGVPADVARRLFAQVHREGAAPLPERELTRGLSKAAFAALAEAGATSSRLETVTRKKSAADSFVKYLFRLADDKLVESVAIPLPAGPDTVPEKFVACISSQAGCALGCVFCATGRLGFQRNLAIHEIVDQVARVRDDQAAVAPVRGLVFMGQGEPFLNYDAVIGAAKIFSDPAGFAIDAKAITISTAGIVPAIRRFTAEGHKFRLAISLTSAIEAKRRVLMPIEKKYPLGELLDAAAEWAQTRRTRITLEYVMLGGENCGEEDAAALVERLGDIPVKLNLIDVNDATGRYQPPTEEELYRFRGWLAPLGQPIVRRYSGGKDVEGACGMLAADHLVPLRRGKLVDAASLETPEP
jgi:23S rRNA (adenine2503-C2)-methyltransferase